MSNPTERLLKSVRLNLADRAVSWLSPEAGLRRYSARVGIAFARAGHHIEALSTERLRSEWVNKDLDPDLQNLDRRKLNSIVQQLVLNNPYAQGAIDRVADNVVGRGIRPKSAVLPDTAENEPTRKPGGWAPISADAAERFQNQADALWEEWVETCDITERMDFYQLQHLTERLLATDGEAITHLPSSANPENPTGVAVELVDSSRIGTPWSEMTNPAFRDGVEIDLATGAPLRYYVSTGNWWLRQAPEFRSIERRMANGQIKARHDYTLYRPGQYRGISPFASCIGVLQDLHRYWEAEIVAARVSACYSAFVKSPGAMSMQQASGTTGDDAKRRQKMQPGMVWYGLPGEEVTFGNPTRPNSNFGGFTEVLLRAVGVAMGLPFELIALDFSKTNYSSARAALLEARRTFQRRQARHMAIGQTAWNAVITAGVASGRLSAPGFAARRRDYLRAHWTPPAWGWVDPVKEETAARESITNFLSTIENETAARGLDTDQIVESAARFHQRLKKAGLPSPWDVAAAESGAARPDGAMVATEEIKDALNS